VAGRACVGVVGHVTVKFLEMNDNIFEMVPNADIVTMEDQ